MNLSYTSELKDKFGYLATWLPNVELALGDVGILHRDRFEHTTTLEHLHIPFVLRERGEPIDLEYQSQGCLRVDLGGSAKDAGSTLALADGDLRVRIDFSRENSVLFLARGCRTSFIEDRAELGNAIRRRYERGEWAKDHVVVTELVETDATTILIARQSGAHVELEANAGIGGDIIRLADASLGLVVRSSFGVGLQIIGKSRLTPLFRASGLRRRLWGGPRFRSQGQNVHNDLEWVDVDYEASEQIEDPMLSCAWRILNHASSSGNNLREI